MDTVLRRCTRCGHWKSATLDHFMRHRYGDGMARICRPCVKVPTKENPAWCFVPPDDPGGVLRRCTKCGVWKTACPAFFMRNKRGFMGLGPWCRPCQRAHGKTIAKPYDPAKHDPVKAKVYQRRSAEKLRKYKKPSTLTGMCERCGERPISNSWRKYCEECASEAHKEAQERWRQAHPDRVREHWKQQHLMRAPGRRGRRYRVLRCEIRRQRHRHRGLCAFCRGNPGVWKEHVIPCARGGHHGIGNLLYFTCRRCQDTRKAKYLVEWRYRKAKKFLVVPLHGRGPVGALP